MFGPKLNVLEILKGDDSIWQLASVNIAVSTTTPDVPTQLTHTTLHKLGLADSLQKVAFQMLQPISQLPFLCLAWDLRA